MIYMEIIHHREMWRYISMTTVDVTSPSAQNNRKGRPLRLNFLWVGRYRVSANPFLFRALAWGGA